MFENHLNSILAYLKYIIGEIYLKYLKNRILFLHQSGKQWFNLLL